VTVTTNRACEFGLSAVMGDTGIPEATKRFVAPGPGRHVVVLPHLQQKAALPADVYTLLVIAEAEADRERRNNIGQAAITVVGKPKVLLVQGADAEGEFIARVLRSQDIEFERRTPQDLPPRAEGLDEFVAVVLAGVSREMLPAAAVDALRRFVEHTGGGLWVVGSSALQGQAGYAGSEFEKLLPVAFSDAVSPSAGKDPKRDPTPKPPAPNPEPPDLEDAKPQKVLAPSVALLLMVDKSGSMAGRNIEIVKEACIKTAKNLSPKDVIGCWPSTSIRRWCWSSPKRTASTTSNSASFACSPPAGRASTPRWWTRCGSSSWIRGRAAAPSSTPSCSPTATRLLRTTKRSSAGWRRKALPSAPSASRARSSTRR
jgi:hypothetical protein